MPELYTLDVEQQTEWRELLSFVYQYDVYHLPEYHELAQSQGEGKAAMWVYQEKDCIIAWPFLLRSLNRINGLEHVAPEFKDITSVYGYAGPVCSSNARNNIEFLRDFGGAIIEAAQEMKIVSMFSRLNPILRNNELVENVGEIVALGETVSIDLGVNEKDQFSNYRKSHRYEIKRAYKEGMTAYIDHTWNAFDDFLKLYYATMKRVEAESTYFWDVQYFERLRKDLGENVKLIVAECGSVICSGAIFIHTNGIIQYHLSGSHPKYAKLAPSKLVIEEARHWGNAIHAKLLHLGGGVNSKEDSLFKMKSGFCSLRHRFYIWKYVVLPDVYYELEKARNNWLIENKNLSIRSEFFPSYRSG